MAGLIQKKLKASTLPEALAAMVIILSCFGICAGIYFNVLKSDNSLLNYRVHLLLQNLAEETKQRDLMVSENINIQELDIRKTVEAYPDASDLFTLRLSAFNKEGRCIEEYKELVRKRRIH